MKDVLPILGSSKIESLLVLHLKDAFHPLMLSDSPQLFVAFYIIFFSYLCVKGCL